MKKLKAFTLIEMLIVIVIIGILAAALIPRLSKARGRANDTARKADLSQIAASLVSYQIDKGAFPGSCGDLIDIYDELQIAGLDTLPTDPAGATVKGFTGSAMTAGEYGYCAITKNGQDNGGFVIAAISETEGGANYVQCSDSDDLGGEGFTTIQNQKCNSFVVESDAANCAQGVDGICHYTEGEGHLRYIYTQ